MRNYAAECARIRAGLELDGITPRTMTDAEYNTLFCLHLRMFNGSTRIVRDLIGDDVEVFADTGEPVPGWWNEVFVAVRGKKTA